MGLEELHDGAEKFDPRTETAFKFLQIFSACCVMFAHGAGEVGYMAGAWDRGGSASAAALTYIVYAAVRVAAHATPPQALCP